jgi:FKBP-type peptidyl-prolyl cis-trans isomerase FklB
MKKVTIVAAMAIVAAVFTSCGNPTPKANLKSDLDSMSYAMGMAQTQGLKDYLVQRLGVDTAYMADFIKGLNEGANSGDDKKRAAYYAGIQIGQQVGDQMIKGINHELFGEDSTMTISKKNFMAGFISGTTGAKGLMTFEQASELAQKLMTDYKNEVTAKQYSENKAEGEKYVANYAKGKDVKTLKGGVLYKVIKEGKGAIPTDTSMVKVHYEGKTIDGNVFDSSYKRGEPVTLAANQVIPGWTTALSNMPVGSVWEVVIPQEQAYQERAQRGIKPFSALIFKIELLGIEK